MTETRCSRTRGRSEGAAELKAAILRRMGFGRIGQPEDAARLIPFQASDAGAWITGQTIQSRNA
jgi:3-oxoacyl-[acyl-carrier protein] reductase